MKAFNYPERMQALCEKVEAEIANYIFHSNEPHEQIAKAFGTNVSKIKGIAKNHGIVRGHGWRPKTRR
jgi:hypothetical protein